MQHSEPTGEKDIRSGSDASVFTNFTPHKKQGNSHQNIQSNHTGANTQLGGLDAGLTRDVYQSGMTDEQGQYEFNKIFVVH